MSRCVASLLHELLEIGLHPVSDLGGRQCVADLHRGGEPRGVASQAGPLSVTGNAPQSGSFPMPRESSHRDKDPRSDQFLDMPL
jgi:hypothetical protein